MKSRLRDVALLAGVHPATASRALNERTRHQISDPTVQRVLAAAKELRYRPNTAAQSLALNRSSTIGVVIGDLRVPLFPPLLRGIDDVTAQAGFSAFIVNTDNDLDRERAHLQRLAARNVDGLIVATALLADGLDACDYSAIAPTVYVLRASPSPDAPNVLSDDSMGIHQAVAHLARLGHTRIGHLAGLADVSTAVTRARAYREAMFEHGLAADPAWIEPIPALTIDGGRTACHALLDRSPDITAIVAFNDTVAFGVYHALRERGLTCPDDISVVGYSDTTSADLTAPPLTTVTVDHHAMGARAARLLLEAVDVPGDAEVKGPQGGTVLLPVTLHERSSTAPPRR
ncbi:MAG: LacI family DNA-binding transcriptional regulator [Dermatophilus congolensis]|nr:LacI family DNA-binding transcriptional regulator [Dermatophilus congolensis]